jgi:hypothetical protein
MLLAKERQWRKISLLKRLGEVETAPLILATLLKSCR